MKPSATCFLLIITCPPLLLDAQTGFNGTFLATVDGMPSVLTLQTAGSAVTGTYREGEYDLLVRGTVKGQSATGTLTDKASGVAVAEFRALLRSGSALDLTIMILGRDVTATFEREGAESGTPGQPVGHGAPTEHRTRDARLAATWSYQVINNSGGSSFTTVHYFELTPDGRYAQYSKSVGGGADWSYSSGGAELTQQGRWYTDKGALYLQPEGQREYTAAARYTFFDGKLVTEDVNGRKIWNRE
jgi:hypothetical protein